MASNNDKIPVEIVSEEEMAFLEAALASVPPMLLSSSSSSPSSFLTTIAASPSRSAVLSLRSSPPRQPCPNLKDIEDEFSGDAVPSSPRSRSLLHRFRARRALTVTDITAAEWCEKQTEFVLFHGKPRKTAAMEAGSNRHAELEKEVLERVEIRTDSIEESWAVRLSNFILGAHQLLFEGLTRELPVIGVWGNTWIVGVIDELRMPLNETSLNPILVDTKTRYRSTLPSEAQKRNARLQLMCYKYLWDGLVAGNFPTDDFFEHFKLNPHVEHLLSAMEACGVDNCRIEIHGGDEVPILDGSANEWVNAIEQVGLCAAEDSRGGSKEKMAPILHNPLYVSRDDAFIIAFPDSNIHITCGINFPQAPSIGHQWFSCFVDGTVYAKEIAPSRTFCIYEEVEIMRKAGLIKGGSAENALVCSASAGWLNPPLRFNDEPCRHKILDLVGDFSLFAQNGSQGLPLAHIVAYKAGHSLHAEFVRRLSNIC